MQKWQVLDELGDFLELLVHTIENSILLQGSSCTLSRVGCAYGRVFQSLGAAGEQALINKLEARFETSEHALRLFSMWLNPSYKGMITKLFSDGIFNIFNIVEWLEVYSARWFREKSLHSIWAAQSALALTAGGSVATAAR